MSSDVPATAPQAEVDVTARVLAEAGVYASDLLVLAVVTGLVGFVLGAAVGLLA